MTPSAHETAGVVTPLNSAEVPLIEDYVVSFASFYAANYRRAVALATVLTGSQAVAEDLVQDAMADAHRRWLKISTYEKPSAWLNQAVANRAVSLRRRLTVRARGLSVLARSPKTPVELVPNDQELWARVRQLPARQAQLIALVYVEAMTLPEAAEVLGIALPTAKPISPGPKNVLPATSPNGETRDRSRRNPPGRRCPGTAGRHRADPSRRPRLSTRTGLAGATAMPSAAGLPPSVERFEPPR
jgi:RNA polymerase sigma-70 factor, ECF subfamily